MFWIQTVWHYFKADVDVNFWVLILCALVLRVFGGTLPSSTARPTSSSRQANSSSTSSQRTRTFQSNVGQALILSATTAIMITRLLLTILYVYYRCCCNSNVCNGVQSTVVSSCEGTAQWWSGAHWGTFMCWVVFYKNGLHDSTFHSHFGEQIWNSCMLLHVHVHYFSTCKDRPLQCSTLSLINFSR